MKKTAFVDRTVIITTLNAAWTSPNSVFDLFLESFGIGNQTHHLLNHLLVVALDQKAYSRCLELHPYCYALYTNGVNFTGEAYFMSSRYLEMMWARIDFLRTVLEKGYNFVFTVCQVLLSCLFTWMHLNRFFCHVIYIGIVLTQPSSSFVLGIFKVEFSRSKTIDIFHEISIIKDLMTEILNVKFWIFFFTH